MRITFMSKHPFWKVKPDSNVRYIRLNLLLSNFQFNRYILIMVSGFTAIAPIADHKRSDFQSGQISLSPWTRRQLQNQRDPMN